MDRYTCIISNVGGVSHTEWLELPEAKNVSSFNEDCVRMALLGDLWVMSG